MNPSPVGAVLELVIGLVFLCAGSLSLRRHHGHPDRHANLGIAVDLVVGVAAVADVASATVHGPLRIVLWSVGSFALVAGLALLFQRHLPRPLNH